MDRDAPIRVRLARHSVRCTTDRSTPELTTVAVAGHTIDSTVPKLPPIEASVAHEASDAIEAIVLS